jgi:hypothetical protein
MASEPFESLAWHAPQWDRISVFDIEAACSAYCRCEGRSDPGPQSRSGAPGAVSLKEEAK